MPIEKQVLTGKQAKLKVNLRKLFNGEVPRSVPIKEAVGQAIIDKILENTAEGRDKDGNGFVSYSDSYANSPEFVAAGKSKDQVNLRLFGDMLDTMDVIEQTRDTITIGWSDDLQATKAHGHVTGNIRKDGEARDFLGLSDDDYESIAESFTEDLEGEATETRTQEFEDNLTTLRSIFG